MIEIFDYDTRRYPFREWAQATLGHQELEALHEHPCGGAQIPTHRVWRFITRMKEAFEGEGEIRELFAAFVREHAVPRVPFVPWTEIFPNMRVHEKGRETTSAMHRDRDYVRERGLFKIWLPFTRVAGGGTLWVESADGRNDMKPYDMRYGQALFFDSLNLMHGCHFNDSNDTRVSMDFMIRPDPELACARASAVR